MRLRKMLKVSNRIIGLIMLIMLGMSVKLAELG